MYKEIRGAWLAEQKEAALQPLGEDFFENAARYLKQLEKLEGEVAELVGVKRERAKFMIMDLMELRLEKIILNIMADAPFNIETLTQRERNVHSSLKRLLAIEEDELEALEEDGFLVVRILVDLPEIVGADLQTYGPFKAEDVATLPKENAIALIRKGAATPIATGK